MFDYEENYDFDEDVADSIIFEIGRLAELENGKTSIIVPQRMMQLAYAYKILKSITDGINVKVTYTLHEPYNFVGSISIEGDSLEFCNTELFAKAAQLASNFEIYPKTDGTVQMNFAFYGLTRTIE